MNTNTIFIENDTLDGKNPPISNNNYKWTPEDIEYSFTVEMPPLDDLADLDYICIYLVDENNTNLYRNDLNTYVPTLNINIKSHLKPTQWICWPKYKTTGWGEEMSFPL